MTNFTRMPGFGFPGRRQLVHWLVPVLLVLLFVSTMLWLPWQSQQMEATERQEQLIADTLWVEQTIRFHITRNEESLRLIGADIANDQLAGNQVRERMTALLRSNREMARIIWFDASDKVVESSGQPGASFAELSPQSRLAAKHARSAKSPQYSQHAPPYGMAGPLLIDYHLPLYRGGRYLGSLVASYSPSEILDEMVPWWFAQENEISLTDSDDTVIAVRAAGGAGRNVYTHQRSLDLPGVTLTLHSNSTKTAPKLLPNLLVGSVIALSIGLLWSLWALWRDITRRLAAEGKLRQEVSFRSAMENSLVTGMRARDLDGRITYANPAFCRMVGMPMHELVGRNPPMPYWAPEAIEQFEQPFTDAAEGNIAPHGYESVFQRNGERFPVLIFESPLVDASGKQTGWMGSILDISESKRIEELNRQQQEKLQLSARLSTMGEIASTLAHELNQPLAAISSYTTGALNLLQESATDKIDADALRPALERASAQAQRAGQIIRSVHTFVKQREPAREEMQVTALVESVMPLVELQAQRFLVTVQTRVAANLPPVLADRVLIEQVLLNLTRNGIEAMQRVPPERRLLRITAECEEANVLIAVIDHGHGISDEVGERLFSPFFSTKAEGMGIGLNICRTAVEFHGGMLTHVRNPAGGAIFRFSLPALVKSATTEDAGTQKPGTANEEEARGVAGRAHFSL